MHTPGPWEFEGGERVGGPNVLPRWKLYRQEFPDTTGKTGAGIVCYSCETFAYLNAEEGNARLMTAAPDLLAALLEARLWLDNIKPRTAQLERDEDLIDAAIAKATGKST